MNILVSNGEEHVNQTIASFFHQRGDRPILLFTEKEKHLEYVAGHPEQEAVLCTTYEEETLAAMVKEAFEEEAIDVLVHGNEMVNEAELLERDPSSLNEVVQKALYHLFLLNKVVVRDMVKRKQGKIIFPLFYDPLYYAGYASSPILNQAKLSLMKCMSRELGAFKINVNSITFGYYNDQFTREEKKATKSQVEIFCLKPKLPEIEEYVHSIGLLVDPSASLIGGENLHVGAGIETGI
ncbi:SDR family NAD(P)-dependent oxidoreductase [Halalkalibacterium halodurans]|uniref:BH1843 protein n=1 Tax=Halalkalibacterium halodurans (strain ATCC BAA-125 / DSM 18197 / FERM 7344 / JCM 9153 / C-125) TaxID=272558 RepID=Q9KBT1_HALH5|nr:SDR family oxidoreductase [Halalkalibacterium halodurans]MDY7222403.1 SDR family oxidoreductase [Halalkalibacterium halodurans]MDY7241624.1 SDR family oxidoreductase [Halalkalibacterium halodurans]MED4082290.1 SDR family NAD(P)-dependent oxidoreductase [Halalkalibacterium halodurans]MED4083559.1 SDR family NAD(P)-dependent oxidoreductase [Halalkalibacterium halodurans]MED4105872.1 SDR family NAD(P)-dependent oxidoreductase [Halalkalibacterium halodurans]